MKTLILMRHAEAGESTKGEPDKARRLTPDGVATAGAVGRYLDAQGYLPDLALVSDAERTRETLDGLSPALRVQPQAAFDTAIYSAGPEELLDHIRVHGAGAICILVIGHNPAIGDLARLLGQRGGSGERARVARGFPPGGLAVFAVDTGSWSLLAAKNATLERFVTPAALPPPGRTG